jgi:DNA-binding protein H-NS
MSGQYTSTASWQAIRGVPTLKNENHKPLDAAFWELLEIVTAERDALEKLVRQLTEELSQKSNGEKRPYPQVVPKYRNPKDKSETWSGRGKQPRWLTAQLKAGKQISDFLISPKPEADLAPEA